MATKILIPTRPTLTPIRRKLLRRPARRLANRRRPHDDVSGLKAHLHNDQAKRSFVNIYINDEDIRYLQKE